MVKIITTMVVCVTLMVSCSEAAYVAMAEFDINGDGHDEIIRTEGTGEDTSIKIYEKIRDSYFFKPAEVIKVSGNLVQVPEVADFTGDAILDLYFATGSDLGIIYYDTVEETYRRQYEVNDDLATPYLGDSRSAQEDRSRAQAESDIYLKMQRESSGDDSGHAGKEASLPKTSSLQTI
ncbi:MAG: VCBS repeat-containing protein [Candidatus Omnitrophica bacterium]|nr:VCBS repeat-containing protein [Candidatus Omnitrophota bacterium]